MVKRKTKFVIPNSVCRYYSEPLGCNKDKKFHTCCEEECTIPEIIFQK